MKKCLKAKVNYELINSFLITSYFILFCRASNKRWILIIHFFSKFPLCIFFEIKFSIKFQFTAIKKMKPKIEFMIQQKKHLNHFAKSITLIDLNLFNFKECKTLCVVYLNLQMIIVEECILK